ncbi:MAG: peptidoglycan editing factor PgeF [Pseudomonadota bacterium]
MTIKLIRPDWPAQTRVNALVTTRVGGVSEGQYAGLNLGINTEDDWDNIQKNRRLLTQHADLPQAPNWLKQVHGNRVVTLVESSADLEEADASVTETPGAVCAVLTADCLPVFLCSDDGTEVAVAHGGWRGLASGILSHTVSAFRATPESLMAWLGPAISQDHFEVGDEVRQQFVAKDPSAMACFRENERGRWQADLYGLARRSLARAGVSRVFGGEFCTYANKSKFFSYRREPKCGRMASLIWLSP